ncbi:MAG: tripartite tricarboxylate transporter TctB family protein [Synergistaceae bacterium]|jgi:hypothetical protein|nr:tripartite tricarboxylate transporter TctB family protein [Synergistaceae bacterium]
MKASPDVKDGLFFVVLCIAALFMALDYHIPGSLPLSPALFPVLTSVVLIGLSSNQIRRAATRGAEAAEQPRIASKTGPVVTIFLLCLAYTAIMQKVGFIAATVPYLLIFLLALGERRPARVILVPVVAAAVIYFFFEKVLSVALP